MRIPIPFPSTVFPAHKLTGKKTGVNLRKGTAARTDLETPASNPGKRPLSSRIRTGNQGGAAQRHMFLRYSPPTSYNAWLI